MTVVETCHGSVRGVQKGGVLQFRGLPFAAPPVGELRWRAPQPPAPWSGVRDGAEFGHVAPQPPPQITLLPRPPDLQSSEDCLTLNVFTPGTGAGRRPVMVWIHGGAFTAGSGRNAWYNGSSFARHGVVVVTINYRLGALGFLRLPDGSNRGLLDQALALGWVKENIAAFGGDPDNVTVFGESAGGMSVGALMGMPGAAGLFRKAVLQSGAASNAMTPERAADVAERMCAKLGGLEGLRAAPAERIVEAQTEVVAESGPDMRLPFQPVVDGTVLPEPPVEAVRGGSAASVRLLTGTNRDEFTLFLAGMPGGRELTDDRLVRRLERQHPGDGRAIYDGYRALLGARATPPDIWTAIETDRVFRVPAIRLAEAAARHSADVWMYLFTWTSPAFDGALGSCHALEIPFVWNSLLEGTRGFTGGGREAEALAAEMHRAWIAFAEAGDPGWERYEPARRATRIFGPGGGLANDPEAERRALWSERVR